jgi:hypothetical protein
VDRHAWDTFLGRFQLRGEIYGLGGCVELTDGKIQHTAIERTMGFFGLGWVGLGWVGLDGVGSGRVQVGSGRQW